MVGEYKGSAKNKADKARWQREWRAQHREAVLDWVERCAYLKKDSECFDQKEADLADKRFIDSFGIRPDANVRRQQRARRSNQVRMNPAW